MPQLAKTGTGSSASQGRERLFAIPALHVEQVNFWRNFAQRLLVTKATVTTHTMHSSLTLHTNRKILSTINYLGKGSTIINYAFGRHLKSLKSRRDVCIFLKVTLAALTSTCFNVSKRVRTFRGNFMCHCFQSHLLSFKRISSG